MNGQAALIAQMARARGLDPKAVLAIASVEGGFNGSIGDHGTSFGPFQMHEGGVLPKGIGNPQQWANSRAGISYALDRIAQVAGGLRGQAAVQAISSRFERPANVPGEISKAMGRYGSVGGGSASAGALQSLTGQLGGGGGNPAASAVAMQMLQQAQGLAQPGQSVGSAAAQNPSMLSDPSSLLAMAMQNNAAQQNISLSPGGKLTVANANPSAPEDIGAVKLAEHYLGTPYVYGGDKPGGFDCSGLLQFVWAKNGINIPRTTYQQWSAGKAVSLNNLQPGDAVFFKGSDPMVQGGHVLPGHVAMYIGNGKVIQAPHTGADVQISPLDSMGPIMGARSFTG